MPDIASVLAKAKHWPVRYHRGELIYYEGDVPTGMYRIDKGCVRLQLDGLDGERQIIAFLFPGDVFGLCVDHRNSSAEAVSDVDLTRYSLAGVLELSLISTDVVFQLMSRANSLFGDLAHHLRQITHLPATERVLWFLNWLRDQQKADPGRPVDLPMSRRDISDYLGLTPETLSRVIRDLQVRGLITPQGRRSFVLRRPVLRLEPANDQGMAQPAS